LITSALVACSSDEKPPRSASYSDGTTPPPATTFRELPGDGNEQEAPPAVPPRERPSPNSDSIQGFGDQTRPPRDAGAGVPESDAGADAQADAGSN